MWSWFAVNGTTPLIKLNYDLVKKIIAQIFQWIYWYALMFKRNNQDPEGKILESWGNLNKRFPRVLQFTSQSAARIWTLNSTIPDTQMSCNDCTEWSVTSLWIPVISERALGRRALFLFRITAFKHTARLADTTITHCAKRDSQKLTLSKILLLPQVTVTTSDKGNMLQQLTITLYF